MNKAKKHRSQSISERLRQVSPTKKQQVRTRMQIAVNLDEALKAKGWKRTQLAEALQVDRSLITKWLSGSHNFTIDTLVQLSMVLKVKLDDLVADKKLDRPAVTGSAGCSVSSQFQANFTINTADTRISTMVFSGETIKIHSDTYDQKYGSKISKQDDFIGEETVA